MSTYEITIESDVDDEKDIVYEIDTGNRGGAQTALFKAGVKATSEHGPKYAEEHYKVTNWTQVH